MTGKQVSAGKQQPVLRGEGGSGGGRASEDEGQSWWDELKSLRRWGQFKSVNSSQLYKMGPFALVESDSTSSRMRIACKM